MHMSFFMRLHNKKTSMVKEINNYAIHFVSFNFQMTSVRGGGEAEGGRKRERERGNIMIPYYQ